MKPEVTRILARINNDLKAINSSPLIKIADSAGHAYELFVCAKTILEYSILNGGIDNVVAPSKDVNGGPGNFDKDRCFKVKFKNDEIFYFTVSVNCYGLAAFDAHMPVGDYFEADIVVVHEYHVKEIEARFAKKPAPQHLAAAYECKFGVWDKGHLRGLLGLRRHLSFLSAPCHPGIRAFNFDTINSNPPVQIILFRPNNPKFLTKETGNKFDLHIKLLRP